ncbi:MAG: Glycosyl transferase family 2 [Syntrophorhabdaceae bacterium PtaU1.Bin034]|nr:MAG: Glycosyl transferase family 2 [Syntrophorhabdaceae bacterium PtaU1.Bin034]
MSESMALVDVLLPTCNRLESLVMTLSGLAGQTVPDIRLVLSDQSDVPVQSSRVVQTLFRVIESRGGTVQYHYRVPSKGIAEQRHFLFDQTFAENVLYLDDDVLMEPWVLETLVNTLRSEECAFVGAFPAGLSYRDDFRPAQQRIDYWTGRVGPEAVEPESYEWERWHLHRAANLYHVSRSIPAGQIRRYKVAWIASCILYDRSKLLEIGGFSFWDRLPRYHSGEEVLVQNLLMRLWGGCAIAPSGTYYSELPSTVLNDKGTVDGHALSLLPEMVARYVQSRHPQR